MRLIQAGLRPRLQQWMCAPTVSGLRFAEIDAARPSPAFLQALEDDATAAILVCPSNPFVSVDPVLALDGVEEALRRAAAPVVAVSPIVGGAAMGGDQVVTLPVRKQLGKIIETAEQGNGRVRHEGAFSCVLQVDTESGHA